VSYQKGVTIWFTGLSGSGKTTIAVDVEKVLTGAGYKVQRLDGDIVRQYLTSDLGFSREDRNENIRRNSFVAKLLTDNDIITLCSFISPYRASRDEARDLIGDFVEVYVNAPLTECEKRDVKGLYAKAREGIIPEFTGVSDPYEPPLDPEIELKTDKLTVDECSRQIVNYLKSNGYI
jgi:adenylylsulfate kinase